ncbi:hypothetical protein TNCV_2920111 [Trichonephila clavipes]|nr:hypothetical protein TNCV_2920111 [Trichonephila clavipes]
MAAIDVDASFRSLEDCFENLENVLNCAGNPSKKLREDARTALGKLKSYISKSVNGSADLKNSDVASASFAKPSYASIVAPSTSENASHSLNNVIVCANENNFTSEEVRQIIRTELNPRKIQVGKRNPNVLLKNLPNEISDHDVLQLLKDQNPELEEKIQFWEETKIRFTLKKFENSRHLVLEMNPNCRNLCLNLKFLRANWNVCKIQDFIAINRCFKCLGYHHKAADCQNGLCCFKCAGEHKSSECNLYSAAANAINLWRNLFHPRRLMNSFFSQPRLRILQLNLHKSKSATQQLILNMEARNIDVAMVQEPHSYKGSLPGFPSSYRVFFSHSFDMIKAAIIARNRNISTFLDQNYLDYNLVTVRLNINRVSYLFVSYYFEPSKNIDFDLQKINQIFSSMPINRLVWSMDANSKSETWFSPFSDSRGTKLIEFISAHNLFVINEDCGPTFCGSRGSSYIDVTAVGTDLLEDVSCWHLPDYDSLSDHKAIKFDIALDFNSTTNDGDSCIFNLKKANWKLFYDSSKFLLSSISDLIVSCQNPESLHDLAKELISIILNSCKMSIPIKKRGMHRVPWWTTEIGCMRKHVNAARRRFQRCKNATLKEIYKIKQQFQKRIELSGIALPSGAMTNSFEETINEVLFHSFPDDCENEDDDCHKEIRSDVLIYTSVTDDPPFTIHEINAVINKLKLKKSTWP